MITRGQRPEERAAAGKLGRKMTMEKKSYSVAIDGPSGAGKSTIARSVARDLGFHYVDTGAIYRTVGYYAYLAGCDPQDRAAVVDLLPKIRVEMGYGEDGLQRMRLNGEDVTDQLKDGMLTLPEVYEDQLLVVETEDDKKDDKKDDSTGGGEQEDKKPVDTKPTDKKPTDTKNNGISGSSNSGTKTDVSTGNSQGTKADLTGTTNGTAAAKTADMQKNVTYFMAAIVSGAVLLILADNRRKRKHGE